MMTEDRNKLTTLFADCWKDADLKARFMSDPKAVFAEYGMPVPDGLEVKVLENNDSKVHITIPVAPEGIESLSDSELANVAGGSYANANCTGIPGCTHVLACPNRDK
jgi:hypothetical protein